ncbi:MAG: hypothetical protein ACYC21_10005 [Eubacteriales bacterium]
MSKKFILGVSILAITGLLAFGAVAFYRVNQNTASMKPVKYVAVTDKPIFSNIKDLKDAVDVVVIAKIEGELGVYNSAMDPADITKEHPTLKILSTQYQARVYKYLKGEGPDSIIVAQDGGELNGLTQDFGFTPMKIGNKYVFFLEKDPNKEDRYIFSGEPYKFLITDGKVKVDTKEDKTKKLFTDKDETTFVNEVINLK